MAYENLPGGVDRAALASKFSTYKPAEITYTDPNQVFQIPVGFSTPRPFALEEIQASRDQMFAALSTSNVPSNSLAAVAARQIAMGPAEEDAGRGLFGIPVLGPILDAIDMPRAMIVSTIKEVGDMFGEGDASLSDWWGQTRDHILAGEVLRDWGVDLPGPLDFVVGFGLDVALDPLTYLAGAGLAARYANVDKVADGLRMAAAGGKTGKASVQAMGTAENIVRTKGVLAAVRAEPAAMQAIGIQQGLRFTVPGTGRLSRRIIERPLSSVSPTFAERMARNRMRGLQGGGIVDGVSGGSAQFIVDALPGEAARRSFNLANPNNAELVVQLMQGKGGFAAGQAGAKKAAAFASRMPASVRVPNILGGKVGADLLGIITGGVGGAYSSAVRRGLTAGISGRINTQQSVNKLARGDSPEAAALARGMRRAGQRANVISTRYEKKVLDDFARFTEDARAANLTKEDFDELVMKVSQTEPENLASTGYLRWATVAEGGQEGLSELAAKARNFWRGTGEAVNEADVSINFNALEDYGAARVREMTPQAQRSEVAAAGVLVHGDEVPLGGNPMMQRRLHDAGVIHKRMMRNRQSVLGGNTRAAGLSKSMVDDVERIEAKAAALGGDSEIAFGKILDDELAQGARYGDGEMHNIYVGEPVLDPKVTGGKNVFDQMDEIDARVGPAPRGKKNKQFSFSQDAAQVVQRHVAVMKGNIRSRVILDIAEEMGVVGKAAQGDLAAEVNNLYGVMGASQAELTDMVVALRNSVTDDRAVANIAEDLLRQEGILPEQVADFAKTVRGEVLSQQAVLTHEIEVLNEVLGAAAAGTKFGDLSAQARALLAPESTMPGPSTSNPRPNPSEIDWLSPSKQRQLVNAKNNRDAALEAIQESTDFIAEMANHFGRLRTTRNELGAIIKQLDVSDTAVATRQLEDLATDLDTSQELLRQLAQNMTDTYRVSDPTVVAALGALKLGDSAASARTALRQTANQMGETAKGLRELGEHLRFIPEDGKFVKLSVDGSQVRVRGGVQPLKGRPIAPRTDTLSSLLGEKGRTGLRMVAATMDDSPQSLAQLKVLENTINLSVLESKLGTFVVGGEAISAIDNVLGDTVALREAVAAQVHSQYYTALEGALDGAVAMGTKSAVMRQQLDVFAEARTQIQATIDDQVERISGFKESIKNVADRRTALDAEIVQLKGKVNAISQDAWEFGQPLPRGKTYTDRARLADNPGEAYNNIRSAQGLKTLGAVYSEQLPEVITNMFRSFDQSFFNEVRPSVGSLTKSKLQGTSFVAPLNSGMTPAQVDELSKSFAEMFQAVARTVDPEAMGDFLRTFARFNNWWKAQAVGTPGFVTRNLMGAAWMNNQLAGVPLSTMGRVRNIRKAAFEAGDGDIAAGLRVLLASKDDLSIKSGAFVGGSRVPKSELRVFEDWYTSGIASGTGGRGIDVRSALDSPGVIQETKGFSSGRRSGTLTPGADFKPFAAIRGWNSDVEFAARGALAHHSMMAGETIEDAAGLVTKYHFDYSDLTPFEQRAKQVIPFWTWQRRALPVLVESIGRQPQAWGRIVQLKGELELNSPVEGIVPDYFGENMGIRLPFKTNGYSTYMLPSLPFRDLAKWAKAFDNEGDGFDLTELPFEFGRPLLEQAIPSYKFPIEFLLKTRSFNQVPLTDTFEKAPNWAKIPVMRQALMAAGLAEEASNGDLMMTDTKIYQVEQFVPFFANVSRVLPQSDPKWEQSDTAKQIATILNMTIGAGLTANTDKTKRNQILKDMYARSDDMKNRRALNLRFS